MVDQKTSTNKSLVVTLSFLIIIILGLASFIIFNPSKTESDSSLTNSDLIDTSQAMPGMDASNISDSTKAFILSENIIKKLSSDPDYNTEQAIAEYDSVYNQATGDLKVYIAIEYATYIYNNINDFNRALEILKVEEYLNENNELDYYNAMLNLYTVVNNQPEIEKYQQIIKEKTPTINPEDLYR